MPCPRRSSHTSAELTHAEEAQRAAREEGGGEVAVLRATALHAVLQLREELSVFHYRAEGR